MWRSIQAFIQAHIWLKAPYTLLRRGMRRARGFLDRRTMGEEKFSECLKRIGVTPGATVMVHCSIDEVVRRVPGMNAVKFVTLLQKLLGDKGTLLVLTSPFSGTESEYVHSHDTFDVRRTPSKTGLFTEVFRRMPGVTRSMQPTHPVAAWGVNAHALTATHHLGTAFGPQSPFLKLADCRGIIVGVGARMGKYFTIMHAVEELHPRTRELLFEKTPYEIKIVNGAETIAYSSHALRTGMKRNVVLLEDVLRADGTVHGFTKSGLLFDAADAKALVEHGLELIERKVYIPD